MFCVVGAVSVLWIWKNLFDRRWIPSIQPICVRTFRRSCLRRMASIIRFGWPCSIAHTKPFTIEVRRWRFSGLLAAKTPEGDVKSRGVPSRLQHTPPASCRINEAAAKSHGERRYSKYSSHRPTARYQSAKLLTEKILYCYIRRCHDIGNSFFLWNAEIFRLHQLRCFKNNIYK